ncbi:uncharacterized protein ATNIH1004_009572 [Aspergillus tanneri]|uniref:Uncharacterized protein n=1 Tax=Aspergillus tanneri TaxID=1220188 RepID=A0A5M9MBL0_9EURO|nr:uncharacterized protein ATNIH1004_009572 [Aspergillus tanneri]KAA8642820.1 hypothetical protein ATNIH1004_009572 [Aspergillus tanneri]
MLNGFHKIRRLQQELAALTIHLTFFRPLRQMRFAKTSTAYAPILDQSKTGHFANMFRSTRVSASAIL